MNPENRCNFSIGIVGAHGRMGSWLERQLKHCGLNVKGIDRSSAHELEEFAETCDVLVLAIPVNSFHTVTRVVGPRLRPDSLLIDIASLKTDPVAEMLKNSVCEVIGAHPMFGPSADSFMGRLWYICPERSTIWAHKVTDFLNNHGTEVNMISPEKHDRLMAVVQTLRHIIITSLGLTLKETGFDLTTNAGICGEWFHKLVEMMLNQFDQPSELYSDLALANRYSGEVLESFRNQNEALVESVLRKDGQALTDLMNQASLFSKSR